MFKVHSVERNCRQYLLRRQEPGRAHLDSRRALDRASGDPQHHLDQPLDAVVPVPTCVSVYARLFVLVCSCMLTVCFGFYLSFVSSRWKPMCYCHTSLCRQWHCVVTLARPISCRAAGRYSTSRFNRLCCSAQWGGRVSVTFYSTWAPRHSSCGTWSTRIPVFELSCCLCTGLFLLGLKLLVNAPIIASLLRHAPFSSAQVPNFRAITRELYRREDRFR